VSYAAMGNSVNGEGYYIGSRSGTAEYRQTNTVLVRFEKGTGLPYTAYPDLKSGIVLPAPRLWNGY